VYIHHHFRVRAHQRFAPWSPLRYRSYSAHHLPYHASLAADLHISRSRNPSVRPHGVSTGRCSSQPFYCVSSPSWASRLACARWRGRCGMALLAPTTSLNGKVHVAIRYLSLSSSSASSRLSQRLRRHPQSPSTNVAAQAGITIIQYNVAHQHEHQHELFTYLYTHALTVHFVNTTTSRQYINRVGRPAARPAAPARRTRSTSRSASSGSLGPQRVQQHVVFAKPSGSHAPARSRSASRSAAVPAAVAVDESPSSPCRSHDSWSQRPARVASP
jgi:hypothetical protein